VRERGARALIERSALVDRLVDAPVVLLEGPGGFGKSTLAAQIAVRRDQPTVRATIDGSDVDRRGLVATMARGARRAGLPDLAATLDPEDPAGAARLGTGSGLTIVIDEVQRLGSPAIDWLADLAEELPPTSALLLTGRRLGPPLARLARRGGAVLVGPDDLRFDGDEMAAAIDAHLDRAAEPHEVAAISGLTDGWPAAVAVAAARLGDGRLPSTTASGAGALADLVDAQLQPADRSVRSLVARLAHLPLLSADVAAALGGAGALDIVLDLGLPVRFRADGWGELPPAVVELLRNQEVPSRSEGRAVAEVYRRRGEVAEAVALLRRLGDHEGVADVLVGLRWDQLIDLGLVVLATLIDELPDELLADRVTLLVQASLAAELHAPDRRPAWVAQAHGLAPPTGPTRRAVDAERARQQGRDGDLPGAFVLATEVLDAAPADELFTRARAHFTRALVEVVRVQGVGDATVVDDLESAAALFRLAGEPRWEANALQALGFGVHLQHGAFERAVDRLHSAVALLATPDVVRGMALTYLAEALNHAGRLDDAGAALREASDIGRRLANIDLIGYAAWSRAELAALRRDAAGVEAALGEALHHGGTWEQRLAAVDFYAVASEYRLLVGDEAGARRELAEAERRAEGTGYVAPTLTARARLEATVGDPEQAESVLDELDAIGVERDRWLRLLFRAVSAQRSGRTERAAELLQASARAAADLDDPTRLTRREPELVAVIDTGSEPVPAPTHIVLLGGFEVRTGGDDAQPAPGHPATLVKLLALRGVLAIDEAVDLLWPEADVDTGRRRLRNLLNRLRATTPGVVERREGSLVLAEGIEVDVHRFEAAAGAALTADPSRRAGMARQALAHHTGELLPADRYDDWAIAPRERVQRRFLALVDLVADDALARGDVDEGLRLVDLAIAAEPLDPSRYSAAAHALADQGRRNAALAMAERGVAVSAEVGIEPDPGLLTLHRGLTSGSSAP
jgi:ATP/maltotriose-dependent transcriptional regulator MalT/DNA-binding SARP family transcriptional activator